MNQLFAALSSTGWSGLVCNVLVVWASLAISILLLSQFGSNFGSTSPDGPRGAPWTPPGAFIGAVWSCLYTLMGLSLWVLNRVPTSSRASLKWGVCVLIAFCLVWPFYAFSPTSRWPGLLGNFGIFLLAACLVLGLWSLSRTAALMTVPIALWITIATATILDGARRYGW